MKKLINDPRGSVREMLEGMVALHPGLALMDEENVVIDASLSEDPERRSVAVISGGGSGHEPAHAGYVGRGMLTAAVAGDVFTSPSVDAVLAAILACAGPRGALLVVKNYTGDRLNFRLAAELARVRGIPVEVVMVADDVALRDSLPREQSRGVAGTVLVHKIAGAAVARGLPLEEVAALARGAAESVATMGISLGACTVPAVGRPGFELGDDEIEFGLGIHGEKGVRKSAMLPADTIVDSMLESLSQALSVKGCRLGVLVNGLGGTPPMELAIVARRALTRLRELGAEPVLGWCGNFMTALEMPGCSLSLMVLDEAREDLLTSPTEVRIWPGSAEVAAEVKSVTASVLDEPLPGADEAGPPCERLQRAVAAVASAMVASEERLTELDSAAGDGDLGASMVRAAQALRKLPDSAFGAPADCLARAGEALRRAIGGSSGPFYAFALLRASQALPSEGEVAAQDWARALKAAGDAIAEIGGAAPGDRTMLDALMPASQAFEAALAEGLDGSQAFARAVEAAWRGVEASAHMHPRFGRAAYLGDRVMGVPDGGAEAVAKWLEAIDRSCGQR